MVANIRCTEIMEDQLQSFTQDQAWQSLKAAAGKGVVPGFGRLANDLVESCITGLALTQCCMQHPSVGRQLPFATVKSACLPMLFFYHCHVSIWSCHCPQGDQVMLQLAVQSAPALLLCHLSRSVGSHTLQLSRKGPA